MLSLFYNENYEMQGEMHYIKCHLKAGYVSFDSIFKLLLGLHSKSKVW